MILFYCPCQVEFKFKTLQDSSPRKTRNQQKTRNTQVKTTDVRTDSLPVVCCPSEQRLFLTHSFLLHSTDSHYCALARVTMMIMTGRATLIFSHALSFAFLHSTGKGDNKGMARANPTRVRE
jgi:hypothetical protein